MPRPRLDAVIDRSLDARLVLLAAPPGYAKTTAMAAAAATSDRIVAWADVRPEDATTPDLAWRLRTAIAARSPRRGDAQARRRRARTGAPPDPIGAHEVLERLGSARGRWVLVLDDADRAAPNAEVIDLLESIASGIPPGCTLVLLVRDIAGPIVRRLARLNGVATVRRTDLRFTREELDDLIRAHPPAGAAGPEQIRLAYERTDGWPAGIAGWLANTMRLVRQSNPAAIPDPHEPPPWESIFDNDVLPAIDSEDREALLRASALPDPDEATCRELLGEDAVRSLNALAAREWFVTRLHTGTDEPAIYRIHPLFREFLDRRRPDRIPTAEVQDLRHRAARRHLRNGAWAAALETAVLAGEHALAVRILERKAARMLEGGTRELLERAFARSPTNTWNRRPRALLAFARVHQSAGNWTEAAKALREAIEALPATQAFPAPQAHPATQSLVQTPAPTGQSADRRRRAEIQALLAQTCIHLARYDEAERLCRQTLRLVGRRSRRFRCHLICLLGVVASDRGRLAIAERYFRRAGEIHARAMDSLGEGQAFYYLAALVHHPRGELEEARRVATLALERFRRTDAARPACQSRALLAFLAAEDGDEPTARPLAEEAARQATSLGFRGMDAFARLTLARCAWIRGRTNAGRVNGADPDTQTDADLELADSLFSAVCTDGDALTDTDLRALPRLGRAEIALARGRPTLARELAQSALEIARSANVRTLEGQARVLLGLCNHAPGATAPAKPDPDWKAAETCFREIGSFWQLHRLLLHRLHAGDIPANQVRSVLEELLLGVFRLRHEPLFLVHERSVAAAVLVQALRRGVERQPVRDLLIRLGEAAIPELVAVLREAPKHEALERESLTRRPKRKAAQAVPEFHRTCVEILQAMKNEASARAIAAMRNLKTPLGRVAEEAYYDTASERTTAPLSIWTLGTLRIAVGERELPRNMWSRPSVAHTLLYLIVERFRWVAHDEILEALYPQEAPEQTRQRLYNSIHEIRKLLEPDAAALRTWRYLITQQAQLRLNPGKGHYFDVAEFEGSLSTAEALADAPGDAPGSAASLSKAQRLAAISALRQALALYKGEFAPDVPYMDLVDRERDRLRRRWIAGTTTLLDLMTDAAQWNEIVHVAEAAQALYPPEEAFHLYLIRAHRKLGATVEARADYRRYVRIMRKEHDAEPSERVRALVADLLRRPGRAG